MRPVLRWIYGKCQVRKFILESFFPISRIIPGRHQPRHCGSCGWCRGWKQNQTSFQREETEILPWLWLLAVTQKHFEAVSCGEEWKSMEKKNPNNNNNPVNLLLLHRWQGSFLPEDKDEVPRKPNGQKIQPLAKQSCSTQGTVIILWADWCKFIWKNLSCIADDFLRKFETLHIRLLKLQWKAGHLSNRHFASRCVWSNQIRGEGKQTGQKHWLTFRKLIVMQSQ